LPRAPAWHPTDPASLRAANGEHRHPPPAVLGLARHARLSVVRLKSVQGLCQILQFAQKIFAVLFASLLRRVDLLNLVLHLCLEALQCGTAARRRERHASAGGLRDPERGARAVPGPRAQPDDGVDEAAAELGALAGGYQLPQLRLEAVHPPRLSACCLDALSDHRLVFTFAVAVVVFGAVAPGLCGTDGSATELPELLSHDPCAAGAEAVPCRRSGVR